MTATCPYDLVIGLDRSDRKADLHFLEPTTGKQWSQTVATQPEALHDWPAQLRQQFPQAKVGLCVEQPAGAVIAFLEAYAWITLHAINPLTLQKYREACVTSRAKADAKDALYLAELLRNHHDRLPVWQPEDSATRKLQLLVSHRRAVVDERTGLTNRLKALLKQYFPQALELCGEELWRPLATDFLLKWPTLQKVSKVKPATLMQFYYLRGSRSEQLIERRLQLIEQAVPLTDEPALLETFALRVQLICRELRLVVAAIKDYDQQIAAAFAAHPDREIFRNLPGAGPTFAPRLLASLGSQRERFANAAALQHYSGIAPVTKQSGGKRHVHRRYLCPKFLRQSFHEYAKESILHSRWAAAYYQQQREKGSPHNTAVRALAFKWQRVIFRLWQDHLVYREETYEAALKQRGSALVARLEHIEVGKSPFKNPAQKN
jgi:transposase